MVMRMKGSTLIRGHTVICIPSVLSFYESFSCCPIMRELLLKSSGCCCAARNDPRKWHFTAAPLPSRMDLNEALFYMYYCRIVVQRLIFLMVHDPENGWKVAIFRPPS